MVVTLLVILLCLSVQRFLKLEIQKPNLEWFSALFARLESLCGSASWFQGYLGLALLFGAVILVYSLFVPILKSFLGVTFTFCFGALVLWFYLDARPLSPTESRKTHLSELFINRYYAVFAVLFWFVMLGPLGVILYAESTRLANVLKSQQETNVYFSPEILQKLNRINAGLNWLPIRLVGLSYALVGQFRPAFQSWCKNFSGLESEPMQVVDYGMIALNWDPSVVGLGTPEKAREVENLTNRALLLWLAVLLIFTIGTVGSYFA